MQTKTIPYTFTRSGNFYFSRRVPTDLLHHYDGPRIVQGLRTKSPRTAKTRALGAAAKLDERWSQLRLAHGEVLGRKLQKFELSVPQQNARQFVQLHSVETHGPTLTDALALYVKQKGKGKHAHVCIPQHRICHQHVVKYLLFLDEICHGGCLFCRCCGEPHFNIFRS